MENTKKGKFIVFEGIDGCGKSTQAKMLKKHLEEHGFSVHLTFEPTYGQTGALLHKILAGEKKADPGVVAALFAADRLEHITDADCGMLSLLESGKTVICDRYYFSSLAYQGAELDPDWVYALNSRAAKLLKPDYTVFIDVSPKECLNRIKAGREAFEIYENLERLTAVRENYLRLFERCGDAENIYITDGNRSREMVFEDILKILGKF